MLSVITKGILGLALFVSSAGACEIKKWQAVPGSSDYVRIEGTTTCSSGRLLISVYDAASDKLVGEAATFFAGARFSVPVKIPQLPDKLSIKYKVM